ncbi:hypothetical protein [Halorientalis litorea]|uniref:hypothetical protein n=1 Tax=Halorientalis litorea TaxID=2931977 RepID=UPI001FF2A684|nr:hypothetical protein [Halorientalis litorea]
MRNPLTFYGGIGWILVGLTLLGGVLAVDSVASRVILAALGLGCGMFGLQFFRDDDENSG